MISPNQDEDLNFFVMIVDKCLSHEAFTPAQKRRLFSWKQQVQKACHPLPPRRSLDNRQRNKWSSYHNGNGEQDSVPCGSIRRRIPVQYQPQRMVPPNYPSAQRSPLSAVIKRPSLQEHMKPHVQVQRTNSAPVRPNPLPASLFGKVSDGVDSNDPELNIRLESLCLSVTEHALGSFDGAVPLFWKCSPRNSTFAVPRTSSYLSIVTITHLFLYQRACWNFILQTTTVRLDCIFFRHVFPLSLEGVDLEFSCFYVKWTKLLRGWCLIKWCCAYIDIWNIFLHSSYVSQSSIYAWWKLLLAIIC